MALSLKQSGIIAFAVALIPAATIGYFFYLDLTAPPREFTAGGHQGGGATEGDRRHQLLVDLTGRYLKDHPEAAAEIRSGKALAPMDYLNAELERDGVKWRVRDLNGAVADIYDVT